MLAWRSPGAVDADEFGLAQQALGQPGDVAVERGGEQQRLAGGRRGLGDALHGFDEAHVQHAVRFVQHQQLDARQIHAAPLQLIDQAPRRRDQNVERLRQRAVLLEVRHAAHDHCDPHLAHELAVGDGGLGDLLRQLARGREHENAWCAGRFALRVLARGAAAPAA